MNAPTPRRAGPRDLFFFTHPEHWPAWPFLPIVRYRPDGEQDLGVLYDCKQAMHCYGFSSTVFLTNLFELPKTEAELWALPREVFDAPEEMAQAGWVVD